MQRFASQLINANEKLFHVAEDDRRFRTPAVGIRMMEFLFAEQHRALAQYLNDVAVRVEDIFADKLWQTGFFREPAVIIYRR